MSKRARARRPVTPSTPSTTNPRRTDRRRAGGATQASRLRTWALPSIFLVAALGVIAVVAMTVTAPRAPSDDIANRPILGVSTATVTIHEYGDFQCPSCGAFARNVEPQIRETYIDTGLVRLAWHDFAWIGSESRDAANGARCAGETGRFWEFHDLLYQSQAGENAGAFSKDRLKTMGDVLGLDPATFHACVDADRYASAVQADFADVRANGFNGTPTFVIGDQRIVGAQPFEVFAAAIDAALAE